MAATRDDWKIIPLPAMRTSITLDRLYSANEFARIKEGNVPEEMEDRWLAYYEEPWLYIHRSWTGHGVYQVRFEAANSGGRVAEAWVNRDPQQYGGTDNNSDATVLAALLDAYAGRDTEPALEQVSAVVTQQTGRGGMTSANADKFPPGVAEQLKTYVYRLIDPRTGETFYIGKGKGDRVFSHSHAEINVDEPGTKLKRIREIRLAGFEVGHVIHRHGLDENTAMEVEAALIDAYPGLTNEVIGNASNDRGAMHAQEIIVRYCAEEAVFTDTEKALLINVNREASERSLYEAVRYAWVINPRKAKQADVILATRQGLIVGAFIAKDWLPATAAHFPGRWSEGDGSEGRYGFVGHEAPEEVVRRYVRKRVPARFRKKGAANPIKYTW